MVGWNESEARALSEAFDAAGARASAVTFEGLPAKLERSAAESESLEGLVVLVPERTDAAYLPIVVLKVLLGTTMLSSPKLWLVTRGAQSVLSHGSERVSADQAAVWGTGRVLAEEHPDVWGGLVDLQADTDLVGVAPMLLHHLAFPDGETQVAFRNSSRFVLRLEHFELEQGTSNYVWRQDAAYLITGGLGEVGLQVARAIVAQGAHRIVLMGRTPLPPRSEWNSVDPDGVAGKRVAAVRALESTGAAVHLACVDVSDEAQMRDYLTTYANEAWPPIRGVIHAAVALESHLAVDLSPAAFEGVMQGKLRAAQILERLLPGLDLFVAFSSIIGYIGLSGEANYAAANTGLDGFMQDRRARGLPALSIGWGVWESTTRAQGAVSELSRVGVRPFTPEQGVQVFLGSCGRATPTMAVLPMDWPTFKRVRLGRGWRQYADLVSEGANGLVEHAGSLTQRLATASGKERRELLEALVRESVSKVLKACAPSSGCEANFWLAGAELADGHGAAQ